MNLSWIKIIKDAYKKSRPFLAFFSVIAVSLSPLILNTNYKIIAQTVLLSLLMSIILDLFKDLEKKYSIINDKLGLKEPPTYEGFTAALPDIRESIIEKVLSNENIELKIIAVSTQFSWKNIVEVLLPKIMSFNNNSLKVKVNFVIVSPNVLKDWGQKKLRLDCKRTIEGILLTIESDEVKDYIDSGRLKLNVEIYDNMPHWHGVLINDDTLYMGRCKWDMDKERKELLVGRRTYRKFTIEDRFQGYSRIEIFNNWYKAYMFRASILKKINYEVELN